MEQGGETMEQLQPEPKVAEAWRRAEEERKRGEVHLEAREDLQERLLDQRCRHVIRADRESPSARCARAAHALGDQRRALLPSRERRAGVALRGERRGGTVRFRRRRYPVR